MAWPQVLWPHLFSCWVRISFARKRLVYLCIRFVLGSSDGPKVLLTSVIPTETKSRHAV